jgi:lysophospholipase L1-like esterase
VLTTPAAASSFDQLRATLQVAASVAVAALSWRYVEEPIRHGALGRIWGQARAAHWRPRALPRSTAAILGGVALVLVLAGIGLIGVRAPAPIAKLAAGVSDQDADAAIEPTTNVASAAPTTTTNVASVPATTTTTSAAAITPPAIRTSKPVSATQSAALRTRCRSVVHFGDSTSEGLTSSDYLPDPGQRIPAQYARVGVKNSLMEIRGATSIVETLPGGVDADKIGRGLVAGGYHGCWVIALGTNDTADVFVGSNVTLAERIRRMMSLAGGEPVLWVDVKSLVSGGPYSESDMEKFNQALEQACPRYPNMRVYDWASAVKDKWFIPDGIHYYSPGYAARAHLIANALAEAFPADGPSATPCLVKTRSISFPVLGVKH